MPSDFEIDDPGIAHNEEEIINDYLLEGAEQLNRRRMELVARAFVAGYDGIDMKIQPTCEWSRDINQFKMGFNYEVWTGDPPDPGIAPRGRRRYDFRTLDKQGKRELAAHAGITDLSDIPDGPREDSNAE